jgi:RNA polymerase sigma-70 factor (sigma-E family)
MTRSARAQEELEILIETHSGEAIRLAYLLTGDRDLAADIAQDSFVRLFARFRHKTGPETFQTYLRSTVVNLCRDHWRKKRVVRDYLARAGRNDRQVDELPSVEVRDELWDALQQLPIRQRTALVLRYFEDLSEQQTADILGCSPGAVKGLVTRGNQAMRELLEESHG